MPEGSKYNLLITIASAVIPLTMQTYQLMLQIQIILPLQRLSILLLRQVKLIITVRLILLDYALMRAVFLLILLQPSIAGIKLLLNIKVQPSFMAR